MGIAISHPVPARENRIHARKNVWLFERNDFQEKADFTVMRI